MTKTTVYFFFQSLKFFLANRVWYRSFMFIFLYNDIALQLKLDLEKDVLSHNLLSKNAQ